MQVEKRHFIINLLLMIAFYLSFLPLGIANSRLTTAIILNIVLYTRILYGIKVNFILFIGTILEIISAGLIGRLFIHYLVMRNILYYANDKFKVINLLEVFVITVIGISLSTFCELLIKNYLEFYIDYDQYQLIQILSIIPVVILYIKKSQS